MAAKNSLINIPTYYEDQLDNSNVKIGNAAEYQEVQKHQEFAEIPLYWWTPRSHEFQVGGFKWVLSN